MGFGVTELLIILVIVALLFGTKKLRSMGSDIGGAVKGFRSGLADDENEDKIAQQPENQAEGRVIEGELEADKKTDNGA